MQLYGVPSISNDAEQAIEFKNKVDKVRYGVIIFDINNNYQRGLEQYPQYLRHCAGFHVVNDITLLTVVHQLGEPMVVASLSGDHNRDIGIFGQAYYYK